jgi:hypothetical protein
VHSSKFEFVKKKEEGRRKKEEGRMLFDPSTSLRNRKEGRVLI